MAFKLSQVYFVFFCDFFSSERLQGRVRKHQEGGWGETINGHDVSFLSDANVLKLECGDACITL